MHSDFVTASRSLVRLARILATWFAIGGSVGASLAASGASAQERPRLTVVVSVDQLRYEYLERFRGNFADDGFFRRVERDGATYFECHHRHAFTLTAPGHAVMLTGTYPATHGVIDNNWYDRASKKTVYCVEDPKYPIVGSLGESELKGVSPGSLLAPTVGDVLKEATGGRAKVFGITLKDRAAILMAGRKADGVYWYDSTSGCWVTSRFYRDSLPAYLAQLNADHTVQRRFAGKKWELLLPRERYRLHYPDDSPFEDSYEKTGRAFPHVLDADDEKHLAKQLPATAFGNEYTLDVAKTLIENEGLGADDVPDILALGLSTNDYVGHAHGPLSIEVEDITLRTDRLLGDFARYLDRRVGAGRWTLFLSADHGVGPVPEQAATLGLPARRNPLGALADFTKLLETHLRATCGPPAAGTYVDKCEVNQVYLHPKAAGGDAERFGRVQRATREFLLETPGVVAVVTREELQSEAPMRVEIPEHFTALAPPATTLEAMFRKAFHVGRSGDVLFALAPYQAQSTLRATHGSPWRYDTHVPLLMLGRGVRPGRFGRPTSPAAIASTASKILRIDPPAKNEETPASEALSAD